MATEADIADEPSGRLSSSLLQKKSYYQAESHQVMEV